MQVRKVAVVATGALATAAAIGSTPAFAADNAGTPEVAPATVGVLDYEGTHRASDEAMREVAEYWLTAAPEQAWTAPWEQEPPQILSVGSGSAVSALAWQLCGSNAVAGVGGVVPVASPNTVLGDCANGNIDIADANNDKDDALLSVLDDSAISALAWQICGSTVVAGVGGAVPFASPNTSGGCDNGNISVGESEPAPDYGNGNGDDGYAYHDPGYYPAEDAEPAEATEQMGTSAPWDQDPPQILSAGSGSAVSGASWQFCGSSGVAGVGGTVPVASPNTALGDCNNGNMDIHGDGGDALFSFLDNSALSVAPWQICGSSVVAGVGGTVPIASPNTVTGDCNNGNISVG
ncbi:MAG: hypothetical protein GEV12_01090 [Micromonosporaceae bacterium]|nr:hypothetical protein [Micromonosporaceae bacterium]